MSLVLITGTANSGKSGILYERVRAAAGAGGSAAVLVPASPDRSRAVREVAGYAPTGVAVATLDDYLDRLWGTLGDGRRIVSAAQRTLLLAETGKTARADTVNSSGTGGGTLRMLASLVRRSPPAGGGGPQRDPVDPLADQLLEDVGAYHRLLHSVGLVERADAHQLVAEELTAEHLPDVIVANYVTSLTPEQELLLVRAGELREVVVAVTYDDATPATWAARSMLERLEARGAITNKVPRRPYTGPAELRVIEEALGGSSAAPLEPQSAVLLSEAWGEDAEAARIVREIQTAIEDGMSPDQIAVVYRSPAARIGRLSRELAQAGIEAEWDMRVPFAQSGLGRALLGALRFESSRERDRVDLLRSPYSPAPAVLADAADAHVRASRRVSVDEMEEWIRTRDRGAARFVRSIRTAAAAVGTDAAVSRWRTIVDSMMGNAWRTTMAADTGLITDASAARAFIQAVESTSVLGCGEGRTEALAAALEQTQISLFSLERPGRVRVMSAERARGRRFECVIIGDLLSGSFPRAHDDDALGAPLLARDLGRVGLEVPSRGTLEDERLLFYQVVTRASRRLVLSRQSNSVDGQPLQASIFIEEVLDLYRHPGEEESRLVCGPDRRLGPGDIGECPGAPITERRGLHGATRGEQAGPLSPDQAARLARAFARARRRDYGLDAEAIAALARRDEFSVTEIERYLECPWRWYVERVMRPRELDARADASARGRLAHEILRRFYDEFTIATGFSRVTPESLDVARQFHARVTSEVLADAPVLGALEVLAAAGTAAATLRVVEQDATFLPGMSPVHREWGFGSRVNDEPERFEGFGLAGRVDRIDVGPRGLVVTDYKSSGLTADFGYGRFADFHRIQLPLYALVASRRLGVPVAGGIYRSLARGKPRGFIASDMADATFVRTDAVDESAMQAVLDDALARASRAVEGIRAGRIDPCPPEGDCSGYCTARAICTEWRPGRDRA